MNGAIATEEVLRLGLGLPVSVTAGPSASAIASSSGCSRASGDAVRGGTSFSFLELIVVKPKLAPLRAFKPNGGRMARPCFEFTGRCLGRGRSSGDGGRDESGEEASDSAGLLSLDGEADSGVEDWVEVLISSIGGRTRVWSHRIKR